MDFLGFERQDGRVGIRNWVGVISVQDNVNPVTRSIVRSVNGTIPITTLFVRGQYAQDLKIAYDTLGGLGSNPNIAAALVVGLEQTSAEDVASRIRKTGKPVEIVLIQDAGGTIAATCEGTRKALRLVRSASAARRRMCPLSSLTVGVECGGSDTTSGIASNPAVGRAADRIVAEGGRVIISETSEFFGAEQVFAKRAVNEAVRRKFLDAVLGWEQLAMSYGVDIRGTNPVADNIRGGLTTIEEKSLGAMAKGGSTPLVDVLSYSEAPLKPGLHFMATPAPAVESMTGLAAAGCQMILFSTGVGNPSGAMVSPTIKVTGNRQTLNSGFADNIDFDVSDILEKGRGVPELGDELFAYAVEVAAGSLTASEILDQRETAISRFQPTI